MLIRYFLPLAAIAGLGFAIFSVIKGGEKAPLEKPYADPPARPTQEFARQVAGAGLVEARRENIPIGTNLPGVVTEVYVFEKIGQKVKAGDPLFRLDDRPYLAELKVREAALEAAEAELHRLENAPRPEDLPIAEAAVKEAEANMANTDVVYARAAQLVGRNAGTQSEYDAARFAHAAARAGLAKATADLAKLKAGTWKEDILVAKARVEQARAQVEGVKIDLERLTMRALVDGMVLQVNVRPGQYAAVVWKEPLVVLGDVRKLHVRADIDEHDLPMFKPNAPAVGYLRGHTDPKERFTLTFVRIEPYVIPKRSLTGDNAERVDTRVLQVIYALPDERPIDVYVGQQMDVYLEAREPRGHEGSPPTPTPPAPATGALPGVAEAH